MTTPTPKKQMGRPEFIVLISMLMALTALAIDMMLPAFGEMRSAFGFAADSNSVALVVTVFFLGIGLGQFLWGPLADALGRKRILWAGLAIYIIAAIGGALSPSLETLLVWRFVAGLGAAAVRVVTYGAVRDRYHGEAMAKTLSYITAIFILVPMIAPSLGAAVLVLGSWRWVFVFFALAALAMAAWSLRLPETLPVSRRIPLDLQSMFGAGRMVVTSRFAMGLILAQTLLFGFFVSYLASSQLIIDDVMGMGAWFPLIFGGSAIAFGLATFLNARVIVKVGIRSMLRYALTAQLAAAAFFLATTLATGGQPPFWLFLAGMLPLLFIQGFAIPNLNSAAMMPMSRVAGTAAAVIGAVSTLGGAVIGAGVDTAYNGTVTPLAIAATVMVVGAFLLTRWSDAVWDRDGGRQLLSAEEQALAAAAAPIEVA